MPRLFQKIDSPVLEGPEGGCFGPGFAGGGRGASSSSSSES